MLGTAGSGKTYLTKTLYDWFKQKKLDVATLNLDAGIRRLPYEPDIDVRDIIDIDEVIDKYNLGPNGAMIASMDLIATKIDDIKSEIDYQSPEYLLIDTPGQIELFAYRSSGRIVSKIIAEESQPVSLFLIDPSLSMRPEGFVSALMLNISVSFQLLLPQIPVLSKSDLIEPKHMKLLEQWIDSPETMFTHLHNNNSISLSQQLGIGILEILEQFKNLGDLLPISSETGYNIDSLVGKIEQKWGEKDDFYE